MRNTRPDDEPDILRKHHKGSPGARELYGSRACSKLFQQSAPGEGKSIVVLPRLKHDSTTGKSLRKTGQSPRSVKRHPEHSVRRDGQSMPALNCVQNEWAGTAGSPVAKLLRSQRRGPGFHPRSGTWLLCAATLKISCLSQLRRAVESNKERKTQKRMSRSVGIS